MICLYNYVLSMLIVVTGVSSLVHLYSIEYMSGDPHHGRFMSYLSLFTALKFNIKAYNNHVVYGINKYVIFLDILCIYIFYIVIFLFGLNRNKNLLHNFFI